MRKAHERNEGALSGSELRENQDNNVQAMRDQGISDACHGFPPFAWTGAFGVNIRLPEPFGVGLVLSTQDGYQEAFAYARAYEANR